MRPVTKSRVCCSKYWRFGPPYIETDIAQFDPAFQLCNGAIASDSRSLFRFLLEDIVDEPVH